MKNISKPKINIIIKNIIIIDVNNCRSYKHMHQFYSYP